MITKENLTHCFDSLGKDEITKCFESANDYILFTVHSFNVGYYATISSHDYSDELDNEANDVGGLFCDKDDFLRLFTESESINPFLIELTK